LKSGWKMTIRSSHSSWILAALSVFLLGTPRLRANCGDCSPGAPITIRPIEAFVNGQPAPPQVCPGSFVVIRAKACDWDLCTAHCSSMTRVDRVIITIKLERAIDDQNPNNYQEVFTQTSTARNCDEPFEVQVGPPTLIAGFYRIRVVVDDTCDW